MNRYASTVVIETTEDNMFVKIPESTLSVNTILTEVGKDISATK